MCSTPARVYYLVADSEQERQQWFDALQLSRSYLSAALAAAAANVESQGLEVKSFVAVCCSLLKVLLLLFILLFAR